MSRTLLLNADGKPIRTVSWQDAIRLIWLSKAIAIVNYDRVVRSPSVSIHLPAVIILKRYAPMQHKNGIRFSMRALLMRDNYTCQYCGQYVKPPHATKDHVVPRDHYRKGKAKTSWPVTSWRNIVLACRPCNTRKRNRTPIEAGMQLRNQPVIPKKLKMIIHDPPDEWHDYL